MNKKRRPQFKEFIKVIQQEQHSFADPITEFLACVYVNFDFDGAQKKMKECEDVSHFSFLPFSKQYMLKKVYNILIVSGFDTQVILNDPFLGKRVEESNYTVVPLKDEFLENARLFIFETYCRIHERIDMGYAILQLYSRVSCLCKRLKCPPFLIYNDVIKWIIFTGCLLRN